MIRSIRDTAADLGFQTCLVDGAFKGLDLKTSGIYVWQTNDGQGYVGQSVNIHSRLLQHRRNHKSIVWAAFTYIPPEKLDESEDYFIGLFEKRHPLLNILKVEQTSQHRPFDELMLDWVDEPRTLSEQERKADPKLSKLLSHASAETMIQTVQTFVRHVIPNYWATEMVYWSVSALPFGLRVNCGMQEVMTVELGLVKPVVRIISSRRLSVFRSRRVSYQYGNFATRFSVQQFEKFDRWDELQSSAIQLMRHTTPLNLRSHCPQILRWRPTKE